MTRAEGFAKGKVDADNFLFGEFSRMMGNDINRAIRNNKEHIKALENDVKQGEKNLVNIEGLLPIKKAD